MSRLALMLLLALPAVAHAKGAAAGTDWNAVAQMILAVSTIVGGGGGSLWMMRRRRQHTVGVEGREQLTARARVAVARDADEEAFRARISEYQTEVEALRRAQRDAAASQQAREAALRAELNSQIAELRADVSQRLAAVQGQHNHAQLLSTLQGVDRSLSAALGDIQRRAGDHLNRGDGHGVR